MEIQEIHHTITPNGEVITNYTITRHNWGLSVVRKIKKTTDTKWMFSSRNFKYTKKYNDYDSNLKRVYSYYKINQD